MRNQRLEPSFLHILRSLSLLSFAPMIAAAQSLTLPSATVSSTGTVALALTLSLPTSSSAPSALQWTLQYPTAGISNVQMTAGPSAASAGKTLACSPQPGAYTCILSGANTNSLAQGVVATVNLTVAATSGNIALGLANVIGVSAAGTAFSVTGTAGTISGASPGTTPKLQTLACAPLSLTSGTSGTCTVTLTSAASSSVPVTITDTLSPLTVPPSVTVPAGAVSAQFNIQAGTTTTTQSAVVTATLNGASVIANLSITPAATSNVRINSGGPAYTDPSGQVWSADTGFSGGSAYSVSQTIPGTSAPALYQSGRTGNFSYAIPVANGLYTVVLKFAEPNFTEPGQRVFNVKLNNNTALTDFDIFAQAGGQNRAVDRSFPVSVSAGQIFIQFATGRAGTPLVTAIEILNGTITESTTPTTATTRLNVGGSAVTDDSGIVWSTDKGFTAGTGLTASANVGNTLPEVYRTARSGIFSYTFAVPNGRYTVILKFAELSYTSSGERAFNVFVNGTVAALSDFDVLAAAGNTLTPVDRSFSVNVTNGSIILVFTPGSAGLPILNGIEIIPQM